MARHYLAEQRTVVRPSHSRRRDRDWAVLPLQLALFSTLHRSEGPHGPSEALTESYAGKPPLLPNLDQAIDFIDTELQVWKRGQKGANRISAALGSVHDAKLLEVHARLYEHLQDQQQRD